MPTDIDSPHSKKSLPDIRLLGLGALAGLLMAGYGFLRQAPAGNDLPVAAVARVNDALISRDNHERALARLAEESVDAVTPQRRAWVLERLIDEELLVQRGLELGMARSDGAVRNAIVNSLIASVTAEADAASPTDEELEQHLAENADRFSFVDKVAVEGWQTDDEAIAQRFVTALRDGDQPVTGAGIRTIPDLPAAIMSIEILRDYLGPAIAAAAIEMPIGSSAVFARRGRWIVVRVLEKESAVVTDLNSIRNQVIMDYRRSLADETLQIYLDDLRNKATIDIVLP
jgi:parvulin-like peptidyl-prolyl isomerase